MNFKDSINIIAQTENGHFSDIGIQYYGNDVTAIDPQLGLMILASSDKQGSQSQAYKSIEIMMDDMQLNLSAKTSQSKFSASVTSRCLSESIDNINEYLCLQSPQAGQSDNEKGVDLCVVQVDKDTFSSCSIGTMKCLKFSNNELQLLDDSESAQNKLGIDTFLRPAVVEQDFSKDDLVLLLPSLLINDLGLDFIRVTISRFRENLAMILRQLNTRALQHGLKHKPAMIICYKNKAAVDRRNWFDRLRK